VRRHTAEVIDTVGAGGGLLIDPSQEIMPDVPAENVLVMIETVIHQRSRLQHALFQEHCRLALGHRRNPAKIA